MTFRPRLLLPILVLFVVALAALVAAPAVARADTLAWTLEYAGPPNIPNYPSDDIPVSAGFNAVSFTDSTHGWAVGIRRDNVTPQGGGTSQGLLATTADGGATWTPTAFGTLELNGVLARGSSDVWAVGADGTIIHWNGSSWTSRAVAGWPSAKAFRAVAFTDASNGWAVGDGLGIAKTTSGGTTWSVAATPGAGATLRSLAAVTTTSAIAVGDGGTMKVLGTDGVGPTRTITGVSLYGVIFDAAKGWAVGDGPTVLRTSNGGLTWSSGAALPLPAGWTEADRAYLAARAVAFSGSMSGIVVGTYQTVWRTPDGGDTWTAERIIDPGTLGGYELRGIAFTPGSADGPVVVSRQQYLDTPDNKARAYKGTWSGHVPPPPLAPTGVIVSGGGTPSRRISWTDNSLSEEGFVVQRAQDSTADAAFLPVATLPADTTSWTDTPVDVGSNLYYRVKSYRGAKSSAWAMIDGTAPVTTSDAKALYHGSATVTLTAVDNAGGSGVAQTYYRVNGATQKSGTSVQLTTRGTYTLEFWSVDAAGNSEAPTTVHFTIALPYATVYTPVAPSTVTHSHSFTVYGYVAPKHSSGYYLVELRFYKKNSAGHYVYHHHVHAKRYYYYSSTKTKYKATVSLPHTGRWRVRAYHSCSRHAGSYSGYDYITVR